MAKKPNKNKRRYAPKDFVIPASDDKGHNTRLQFRCNPAYMRRMDVIISSKKFPYQTTSDLLRDALHRHLNLLRQLEPEIRVELVSIEVVNRIINDKRERIDFTQSFEELARTINDLVARGAVEEAKRTLGEVLETVAGMEEGFWRNWYTEEVKKRFGYLLDEKGVDLPGRNL